MKIAFAKRVGHCSRNLGLGQNNLSTIFSDQGFHSLLLCDSLCPPTFRSRLCNSRIGLGLIRLQTGANIFPDVNIGNID